MTLIDALLSVYLIIRNHIDIPIDRTVWNYARGASVSERMERIVKMSALNIKGLSTIWLFISTEGFSVIFLVISFLALNWSSTYLFSPSNLFQPSKDNTIKMVLENNQYGTVFQTQINFSKS